MSTRHIKKEILKMLEEDFDYNSEKDFNKHLEDYNAYDDEDKMQRIVEIVSNDLTYDYIARVCDGYGQVGYWSKTIQKIIMLTMNEDFRCMSTLDEIIEAIKFYGIEAVSIEKKIAK